MTVRNLKPAPVTLAGVSGFQLQGIWRMDSDSFWEPIVHAAVFPSLERAAAFLERVQATPSWNFNWEFWGKPVSTVHSNLDAMQGNVAPFSVLRRA